MIKFDKECKLLWKTPEEIKEAEARLLQLTVQYKTGNYDHKYDLLSEIKISEKRVKLSVKALE